MQAANHSTTTTRKGVNMKRILLAIFAIILCLAAFSGCDKECDHNWERIGNYNESTAQDKCSKCGETRLYTDPDIFRESVYLSL